MVGINLAGDSLSSKTPWQIGTFLTIYVKIKPNDTQISFNNYYARFYRLKCDNLMSKQGMYDNLVTIWSVQAAGVTTRGILCKPIPRRGYPSKYPRNSKTLIMNNLLPTVVQRDFEATFQKLGRRVKALGRKVLRCAVYRIYPFFLTFFRVELVTRKVLLIFTVAR